MIKGSLLCSVLIVKRFRAKISVQKWAENLRFWGFRSGKILTLTIRPIGNQYAPKHVIWRKKMVSILIKMWSPEAGEKSYKKITQI